MELASTDQALDNSYLFCTKPCLSLAESAVAGVVPSRVAARQCANGSDETQLGDAYRSLFRSIPFIDT